LNGRVVYEDVQAGVMLQRLGDELGGKREIANVATDGERPLALVAQTLHLYIGDAEVYVLDCDRAAVGRQRPGDRQANAAPGAGEQRDLAVEREIGTVHAGLNGSDARARSKVRQDGARRPRPICHEARAHLQEQRRPWFTIVHAASPASRRGSYLQGVGHGND
jgi:hypothetical protein